QYIGWHAHSDDRQEFGFYESRSPVGAVVRKLTSRQGTVQCHLCCLFGSSTKQNRCIKVRTARWDVSADYQQAPDILALLLGQSPSSQLTYDGWLTDMSGVVDLADHSMLEPLNGYIALDPELNWTDVNRAPCSGQKHSSSGRHLLFPMRCMFSAALQSLSSHLPGCGAGFALAALPLPLPLVAQLPACCAWLEGECWALALRLLAAGRTRRGSTCPAGGFQPAGLVALSLFSCLSQGCWPFTAELTRGGSGGCIVSASYTMATCMPPDLLCGAHTHCLCSFFRSPGAAYAGHTVALPLIAKVWCYVEDYDYVPAVPLALSLRTEVEKTLPAAPLLPSASWQGPCCTSLQRHASMQALSLPSQVPSLFYRKDALAAVDMPPPNTWDELVLLLHKLNGSDFSAGESFTRGWERGDCYGNTACRAHDSRCQGCNGGCAGGRHNSALCLGAARCTQAVQLLSQLLASMSQAQVSSTGAALTSMSSGLRHGTVSGWLLHPNTMQPLTSNQAFLEALTTYATLMSYTRPGEAGGVDCSDAAPAFLSGASCDALAAPAQVPSLWALTACSRPCGRNSATPPAPCMARLGLRSFRGLQGSSTAHQVIGTHHTLYHKHQHYCPVAAHTADRTFLTIREVISRLAVFTMPAWDAGRLELCTPASCPHATMENSMVAGERMLVNRAPFFGQQGSLSGGTILLIVPACRLCAAFINPRQPKPYKHATYGLIRFLYLQLKRLAVRFVALGQVQQGGAGPRLGEGEPGQVGNISLEGVDALDPPLGMLWASRLDTSPPALASWQSQGYPPLDASDYLRSVGPSLGSANIALDMRISSGQQLQQYLSTGLILLQQGMQPTDVMALVTVLFQSMLNAGSGPLEPRPGYSSPLAGSFPCSGQKHSSSGRHLLSPMRCMFSAALQSLSSYLPGCGAGLALAVPWECMTSHPMPTWLPGWLLCCTASIIVPVVVAVVGTLMLAMLALSRNRVRGILAKVLTNSHGGAPRLGSNVTLLVTDIQDSTTLWETLTQDNMNAAVELHHGLVRKLLVQHNGYGGASQFPARTHSVLHDPFITHPLSFISTMRVLAASVAATWQKSATEGDAFILAFHTPSHALHWAQAFQQGLLHLAWPEQLLQLEAGAPVWAAPGAGTPSSACPATPSVHRVKFLTPSMPRSSWVKDSTPKTANQLASQSTSRPSLPDVAPLAPRTGSKPHQHSMDMHSMLPATAANLVGINPDLASLMLMSRQAPSVRHMPDSPTMPPPPRPSSQSIARCGSGPTLGLEDLHSLEMTRVTPTLITTSAATSQLPSPTAAATAFATTLTSTASSLPTSQALKATKATNPKPTTTYLGLLPLGGVAPEGSMCRTSFRPMWTLSDALQQAAESQAGRSSPSSPAVDSLQPTWPWPCPRPSSEPQPRQEPGPVGEAVDLPSSGPGPSLNGKHNDSFASPSPTLNTYPSRTYYQKQWSALDTSPASTASHDMPGSVLVFRGLRVRVGLHSGVYEGSDALLNKTTGRMQYGGRPLAMAKAVGDVGQGGMVLLSQAAFEQLPVAKLASFGMLLNMGDYVFTKDESLPATPIYQAFGRGLEHRAAFLQGPLRASEQLQAGVLDAPLGDVSITFANLVGVGTLMAWDKTLASAALDLYHVHAVNALKRATRLLYPSFPARHSSGGAVSRSRSRQRSVCSYAPPAGTTDPGYLVELSGGLCLAAFLSPAAALLWALQLRADLLEAPWQEELLAHELCEEVNVTERPATPPPPPSPLSVAAAGRRSMQEDKGSAWQSMLSRLGQHNPSPGAGAGSAVLAPVSELLKQQPAGVGSVRGGASGAVNQAAAAVSRGEPASLMHSPQPLASPLMHAHRAKRLLFRGPRLKVGVDVGRVHADINPVTGRMTYRGRVMNRAARIADKAHSGSVWCSHAVWEWCCQVCPDLMVQLGIEGLAMGQFSLKGVTSQMELVCVNTLPDHNAFARGKASTGHRSAEDIGRVSMMGDVAQAVEMLSPHSSAHSQAPLANEALALQTVRALQALQKRSAAAATRPPKPQQQPSAVPPAAHASTSPFAKASGAVSSQADGGQPAGSGLAVPSSVLRIAATLSAVAQRTRGKRPPRASVSFLVPSPDRQAAALLTQQPLTAANSLHGSGLREQSGSGGSEGPAQCEAPQAAPLAALAAPASLPPEGPPSQPGSGRASGAAPPQLESLSATPCQSGPLGLVRPGVDSSQLMTVVPLGPEEEAGSARSRASGRAGVASTRSSPGQRNSPQPPSHAHQQQQQQQLTTRQAIQLRPAALLLSAGEGASQPPPTQAPRLGLEVGPPREGVPVAGSEGVLVHVASGPYTRPMQRSRLWSHAAAMLVPSLNPEMAPPPPTPAPGPAALTLQASPAASRTLSAPPSPTPAPAVAPAATSAAGEVGVRALEVASLGRLGPALDQPSNARLAERTLWLWRKPKGSALSTPHSPAARYMQEEEEEEEVQDVSLSGGQALAHASFMGDDQSSALKEAQLLSQLDHPNIIGYKESFIDPKDGALCIITTFCEEGDLFTRISKRRAANQFFSEHEIMDMFVQIASSLQYIHSKRILHRDLKTQNIFLSKGNIIKLGDFGISKVLEKTDQFATTVTGTPYYMAPEICTNQPYTFKSDIWSLGCVLYELCTLKHAFAADSLLSLVYQIVRGNFPPIPPNQFSQGLSNLVNALLVIAMPYVHQSVQRYRQESQRNLEKQSSTMARRQQLLDKTGEAAAAQGLRGGAEEDAALTPKERLARNKERQRQQRELELKLASLNTAKEQGVAAQRKAAQIQGTNALGLPGSAAARSAAHQVAAAQQQQQGLLGYDEPPPATPSSAGAQLLQSSSGRRGGTNNPWNAVDPPNQQQQQGGGGMGDSMVNMGTMPGDPERLEQTALLVESTKADLVASQVTFSPSPQLDQAAPRQGSSSSVQRSSQRLHQLALALALPSLLPGLALGPVFVEPEFSAWDCQLLSRLGGRALALPLDQAWEVMDPPFPDLGHLEGGASASGDGGSAMPAAPPPHPSSAPCSPPSPLTTHSGLPGPHAPEPGPASPSGLSPSGTTGTDPPASGGQQAAGGGSRQAAGSGGQQEGQAAHRVLLYMPCCPRTLYDQVLARQLAAGSLPSLALLGNSLAALGASAQLFKVRQTGQRAGASGQGAEWRRAEVGA
ncbi:hypothetical protein QJQ45_018070, partial [Haematococcus lacustris]